MYLYGNLVYNNIYKIMRPYKNYLSWPQILAQTKFNKAMAWLQIEVEHGFTLHQNLWTWNGFYLNLKIWQRTAVRYTVLVILLNIWTCLQNNQTSFRYCYSPPEVEEYLQLDEDHKDIPLSFSASNSGIKISVNEDVKSERT